MASNSSIEWTDASWNPVTGCTKVSPGCANCYAERMTRRLQAMGHKNYSAGFEVATHEGSLYLPERWLRPQHIFVNSMSDLFHDDVPDEFIFAVFDVMTRVDRHRYQILTKRSERLLAMSDDLPWPEHIWMGVSVEDDERTYRIEHLGGTGAAVKFVSFEPLLGPIEQPDLACVDWAIVGGESGPGSRPLSPEWVLDIRDWNSPAFVDTFS